MCRDHQSTAHPRLAPWVEPSRVGHRGNTNEINANEVLKASAALATTLPRIRSNSPPHSARQVQAAQERARFVRLTSRGSRHGAHEGKANWPAQPRESALAVFGSHSPQVMHALCLSGCIEPGSVHHHLLERTKVDKEPPQLGFSPHCFGRFPPPPLALALGSRLSPPLVHQTHQHHPTFLLITVSPIGPRPPHLHFLPIGRLFAHPRPNPVLLPSSRPSW